MDHFQPKNKTFVGGVELFNLRLTLLGSTGVASLTVPHNATALPGVWQDAERRRCGEEQGAHPGGAPGEREHRETPAGSGDLLRDRPACHTLRSGPAEYHLAAVRV